MDIFFVNNIHTRKYYYYYLYNTVDLLENLRGEKIAFYLFLRWEVNIMPNMTTSLIRRTNYMYLLNQVKFQMKLLYVKENSVENMSSFHIRTKTGTFAIKLKTQSSSR